MPLVAPAGLSDDAVPTMAPKLAQRHGLATSEAIGEPCGADLSRRLCTTTRQQVSLFPETDTLPHFPNIVCFNALGFGPLPMIVVPNMASGPAVFGDFREYFPMTSPKSGWVNGEAYVEWTWRSCEWVGHCWETSAPVRRRMPFLGSAGDLGTFSARGVHELSLLLH
jgi:hypothetical protein